MIITTKFILESIDLQIKVSMVGRKFSTVYIKMLYLKNMIIH